MAFFQNDTKVWNINLYIFNLALLITHEIDSAFWKEWDLFGLPGGIEGFLIANFFLALIALIGFKQLIVGKRSGYFFALLLAGAGMAAFFIHLYFILTGHQEFTLIVSLIVLALMLIVSVIQGTLTIRILYRKS